MISKHILSTIEQIKNNETLSTALKHYQTTQILSQINDVNITDAYVILDFIKSLSEACLEAINDTTINHIRKTGDNEAFGVELNLLGKREIDYNEDETWKDIHAKLSIYQDALLNRESVLREGIKLAEESSSPPPVTYKVNLSIQPKPIASPAATTETPEQNPAETI